MRLHGFKSFAKPTELEFGNNFNVVIGPNGSGKSLSGESKVLLSNGEEIKIKKLAEKQLKETDKVYTLDDGVYCKSKEPIKIFSLNPLSMKNEEYQVSKFIRRNGEPFLYKIKTRTGKSVTCTGCHPVMVFRENRVISSLVKDLKNNDAIATPRIIHTNSTSKDKDFARLFSYLVGDGYIRTDRIEFGNDDKDIIEDLKRLVFELFGFKPQYEKISGKNYTKLIYYQKDFINKVIELIKNKHNKYTTEYKYIPNYFLSKDLETTSHILAGLYDTDGFVHKDDNTIEFSSKNERLTDQVQSLFLRFGIVAVKKTKVKWASNTAKKIKRKYYFLYIQNYKDMKKFYENIPLKCKYKIERLEKHLKNIKISNPNIDLLPIEVNQLIKKAINLLGIKYKPLRKDYPKLAAYMEDRCNPTRQGLQEIIPILSSKLLEIYTTGLSLKQDQLELVNAMDELGLSGRQTSRELGLSQQIIRDYWAKNLFQAKPKNLENFYNFIKSSITYRIEEIKNIFNTLYNLANSDIFWDEITSIEKVKGEKYVYDLTIPNNHNFIADGIFVHNSNIMDALTFVLGNISAKSMRAEKAANLIFNGGKKGSAMKDAEVALFFDNSKKEFPVEHNPVKVSRIIKDSGSSVYKMNDDTVTRQQILELLSHAKIDPDGHNIVLQGDITYFMEMKPEERRQIIEEVSGISIYEDKKQKAMLELTKVDTKLNEAEIILTERSSFLRELKKERDQALKYKELEKNIKSNKATFLHIQMNEAEEKRDEVEKRINEHQSDLDKINNKIKDIKEKIDNEKKNLDNVNKDIEEKGEIESLKIQKEIEDLRTSKIRSEERLNTCKTEIEKINERIKQLNEGLKDNDNTIYGLENSKKELEKKAKEIEAKEAKNEEEIKKFKEKYNIFDASSFEKIEKEFENLQSDILETRNKYNNLLQKKFQIDSKINFLKERIKQGEKLEGSANLKKNKNELKKVNDELTKLLSEDSAISIQFSNANTKLNDTNTELYKLNAKTAAFKEHSSTDLAINKILSLKNKNVHGLITDLGKIDSRYTMAMEVAAGSRMKAIVVEDDKTAAECIKVLKENKLGTCLFLPLNKIKGSQKPNATGNGVLGNALDLIEFDSKYKEAFSYVFGSTLIVNDVETARRIGVGKCRMVTLDGDLFESSGAIVGGFRKHKLSFAFKEKDVDEKIKVLEDEIEKNHNLIKLLNRKREDNHKKISELRNNRSLFEAEIFKIEQTAGSIDIEKLEEEIKQLSKSQELKDVEELEELVKNKEKNLEKIKKEKEELKGSNSEQDGEVINKLDSLETKRNKTKEELIQCRNEIKNIEIQISSIYQPEKEKALQIIKQQEKEFENFRNEAGEIEKNLITNNKHLAEKDKLFTRFQRDYKDLFLKRNKISEEITKREAGIGNELTRIREIEGKINNLSINRAKIVAEYEGLAKEFEQYQGVSLRKGTSIEELKLEIRKFEQSLIQMGNVNLKALEVYEDAEKEYNHIMEKAETLKTEKNDVLNMIGEIEKNKKGLFIKTYKEIANNFKNIFMSLSRKGEAFLELENKEDPLSEGLDIKVRLVGNKFLDIKSLSGGEKTLTALAFLFAIQEYQPASFYLLDEVDAALDKTNAELLSKLIAKYSQNAQYILISHNDAVITEAPFIYGVSMQENGVSKIVSLKI